MSSLPHSIPVVASVDVVIAGGGSAAVAAAESATRAGARVFLIAPRPYLGEDLCATLRLEPSAIRVSRSPLFGRLFPGGQAATPGHIKATLIRTLLDAGVQFTFGAFVSDVLLDRDGQPAGVVLVDRTGRRAIIARVLIDATPYAWVCRMAGCPQTPWGGGLVRFERGIIRADALSPASGKPQCNGTAAAVSVPPVVPTGCPDQLLAERSGGLGHTAQHGEDWSRFAYQTLEALEKPPLQTVGTEPDPPKCQQRLLQNPWLLMVNEPSRLVLTRRDASSTILQPPHSGVLQEPQQTSVFSTGGTTSPPAPGLRRAGVSSGGGFASAPLVFDLPMPDFSFVSLAAAENRARALTALDGLQRAAEALFCVPPFQVLCQPASSGDPREPFADLAPFRPRDRQRMFVLSGCADLSRDMAASLLQPGGLIDTGVAIGRAAAEQAADRPEPAGVYVPPGCRAAVPAGQLREGVPFSRLADPSGCRTVADRSSGLPVLAEVDVLVIGGGTAGAPAAIAAARHGVRTLVVESQAGLGGMGTVGMIGKPYHGRCIGFAATVPWPQHIERKMDWYRTQLAGAGGVVWYGVMGCGALVAKGTVNGAIIATPEGRGIVIARVVIDATGNADVAAAAGAQTRFAAIEEGDLALQGTGLPPRAIDAWNRNTDCLLVDETDSLDAWRAWVSAQLKYAADYDCGTLIQTRERRTIVGDHVLRYADAIAGRTYPDTVVVSESDYDSHGYPSAPFFALIPHDEISRHANHPAPGGVCATPYRCLLPRGLDGLLVIGIGISMDRDAAALVRMQLDLANQGYAAGVAAAMAAAARVSPRQLDVSALQRHLVDTECLPPEMLRQRDNFPLPAATVRQAVADYGKATDPQSAGKPLAIMMTHADTARPLLRQAYAQAAGRAKLLYAQVLGVWGESGGLPTLLAALGGVADWDEKIFQGRMAEYAYLPTPVDAIILALGHTGDRAATPAILRMADRLDAQVTLSHHRAVALALERLGDPAAAPALAALLRKPGMQGYVMTALPALPEILENRTASLREITLARALYHCGDQHGLGRRILEQYRHDWRGLFARHARAVLTASTQAPA